MPVETIDPWENGDFPYWYGASKMDEWTKVTSKMLGQQERFTPDLPELNRYETHLVFVYGTLKTGCCNNYKLSKHKRIGRAWTQQNSFILCGERGYPPAALFDFGMDARAIEGEVYEIDPETLVALDRFEGNQDIYHRRRVEFMTESGQTGKAWFYYGDAELFKPYRECLMPYVKTSGSNLEYYTYEEIEFDDIGKY